MWLPLTSMPSSQSWITLPSMSEGQKGWMAGLLPPTAPWRNTLRRMTVPQKALPWPRWPTLMHELW